MVTLLWAYYYKADSKQEIVETFRASNINEARMYIAQRKNLPLSSIPKLFEIKALYENNL
jgi:hypothetical protein